MRAFISSPSFASQRLCWTGLQSHTVCMGSSYILHPSLVGASSWLILWALFSLLIPVLSDAHGLVGSVEKGVANEKESSLQIDGERGVVSSIPLCVKLAHREPLALHSEGDVVIGGVFPLHYVASQPQHSYQSKPQLGACSG